MSMKLPYYMVYPMPLVFDDERIDARDYEYMRSMYPDLAKRLLPYVEEECDRCEYPCSMMYDEYPDKLQLRLMSGRICGRVYEKEKDLALQMKEWGEKEQKQNWIEELIEVLLYQELYKRRSDERRMRRKFY